MRTGVVLAMLSILLMGFVGWYCGQFQNRLDRLVGSLDPRDVGRGPDYGVKGVVENAEAFAIMATVYARLGKVKAAKAAADWLVLDGKKDNRAGWGLPFSWDAFGDGSVNSVDTVYGVSVALGVRALLDVCEFTGEKQYCESANEALRYYQRFYTRIDHGGFFWYSDREQDAISVYNVNALLSVQYARASKIFARAEYADLAEQVFSHFWAKRKESDLGVWWAYGERNSIPNDLVHSVIMVDSVLEYAEYARHPIETKEMVRYLGNFIEENRIREFVPHPEVASNLLERPARVWGIGALMGVMAKQGEPRRVSRLMKALDGYEFSPGAYGLIPGQTIPAPILKAYVALGLVDVLQHGCVPCGLVPAVDDIID